MNLATAISRSKSNPIIIVACILFGLNSCNQNFKKLDDSGVDSKKIQIAQKFANNCLTKLKNGSYYQFQDEAIDELKNLLTEQNQKAVYQQLKDKYGDFQSLEYAETWVQYGHYTLYIFRFISDFEKSNKKIEIRVVLNESDKISGFWIKPWSDILK